MVKTTQLVVQAAAAAVLLTGTGLTTQLARAADAETIKLGKDVAYDRKKGNCLACHMMGDGESPGDLGPPMIAMKARFPDRAKLRAQVYDATQNNPNSRMPPFGKHRIVSEQELDAIVDYLYTL